MAQDRLIAVAAGAVVLVCGISAELLTARSVAAGILDWAIGGAWIVATVRATGPVGRGSALGLVTAAAWFLATALTPVGSGMLLAIAYRGPLMHWVTARSMSVRTRTPVRVLIVVGYVVPLVSTTGAAAGTGLVSLAIAATLLRSATRNTPADLRRVDAGAGALAALLGAVWLVAALSPLSGTVLQAMSDVTLLGSAWYLSRRTAELTTVIGSLMLDLGPTSSQASPVSASLAAALADPGLRIRAFRPDLGWRDELGRSTVDPATDPTVDGTTTVDTSAGGRVVLLHGRGGVPDTDLARAAAAAAALVLERIAVEAQVQHEAGEVRRSAARLVTVNDAEREALANQLEAGPIARLGAVGRSLQTRRLTSVEPVADELDQVMDELHRLAFGLNPVRISEGRLDEALRELAENAVVDVRLTLRGSVAGLSEAQAALVYFVSAELLTNVARHSGSPEAALTVSADHTVVLIEIRDSGSGGASKATGHGLQGLADRMSMAGGSLEIDSPTGGPTIIRASAPRESAIE